MDTALKLEPCKAKARKALLDADFSSDVTALNYSVLARRGGSYTAALRCVPDKEMIIFVVSGPDGPKTERYLDVLVEKWKR